MRVFQATKNLLSKTSKPTSKMSTPTVKTRILIISDTHSTPLAPTTSPRPFRQPLPPADVLIHCGDLTMYGLTSEYEATLDMLAGIEAKVKLVIAGNHDRTLDEKWMRDHQTSLPVGQRELFGEAREFWFGEQGRARKEGVRMLEEGVHRVDLENGAVLTVSLDFFHSAILLFALVGHEGFEKAAFACFDVISDPQNSRDNTTNTKKAHNDERVDGILI